MIMKTRTRVLLAVVMTLLGMEDARPQVSQLPLEVRTNGVKLGTTRVIDFINTTGALVSGRARISAAVASAGTNNSILRTNTVFGAGEGIVIHQDGAGGILVSNTMSLASGENNVTGEASRTNAAVFAWTFGKSSITNVLRTASAGAGLVITNEGTNLVFAATVTGGGGGAGSLPLNANQFDTNGVASIKDSASFTNPVFYSSTLANTVSLGQANEFFVFYDDTTHELVYQDGRYSPNFTNMFGVSNSIPHFYRRPKFDGLVANRVAIIDSASRLSICGATDTEAGYLSGVTGGIQTNVDARATIGSVTVVSNWVNSVSNLVGTFRFLTNGYTESVAAGTAETNLTYYTLPGGTLVADSSALSIRASGSFAANADLKEVKLKFGGTTLLRTGSIAINGTDWVISAEVTRTGAATQIANATFISGSITLASTANVSAPTETLSGDVLIVCTGTGATTGDVTQKSLTIHKINAP